MNHSNTKTGTRFTAFKTLHAVLFVISMMTFNLNSANAWAADFRPDDIRVLGGTQTFDNTWQYAAVFKLRPPRRLRVQHTSNGGLKNSNPGLDLIGLNFSYDFGGERP